jgi:plasmid maintenance system antidote protein VapI
MEALPDLLVGRYNSGQTDAMGSGSDSAFQVMWDRFVEASLADRDALVAQIAAEIKAALPSYRDVPEDLLGVGFAYEFEKVLRAARTHRELVSDEPLSGLAEIGEARALQRVPAEEMLLAWRIGVQVVLAHSRIVAARIGIPAEQVLEYVESLLRWSDRAMVIMAAAHRRAELDVVRHDLEERARTVRAALRGTDDVAGLRARIERGGLDATREYVTVCCRVADDVAPTSLERALGFQDTVRPRQGLSTVMDGELVGILRAPPSAAVEIPVGVGPPRPLERLRESFALARRAARTAGALGLVGIRAFDDLGVLPAVVDDPDVGDALRRRYLDPLTASATEIAESLRMYFHKDMSVERAAEALHVHPNTLRYRMSRFEELTGAKLRDPATALEVWWALQRDRVGRER